MAEIFLSWCAENRIWIHPAISIRSSSPSVVDSDQASSEIGIFASDVIPSVTAIAKIPKTSVLSHRSCSYVSLLDDISRNGSYEPTVMLSLAVMLEINLGRSSRWWGYLQSLPRRRVDLAGFWSLETNESETAEAMNWLSYTELSRAIKKEASETLPTLSEFFDKIITPLVHDCEIPSVSLENFYHAFSLVSSRAFHVDSYHQVAMVPVADAFNHVEENTVHLETDYHVCAICGSLDECLHDLDTSDNDRLAFRSQTTRDSPLESSQKTEDLCEMVTNSVIFPGDEIFNSYDSTLNNVQLMVQYGFMLEGNSNDLVSWGLRDIDLAFDYEPLPNSDIRAHIWSNHANDNFLLDSYLLFNPALPDARETTSDLEEVIQPRNIDREALRRSSVDPREMLCINAEAQVSQQLWLYLVFRQISLEQLPLFFTSTPHSYRHSRQEEIFLGQLIKEITYQSRGSMNEPFKLSRSHSSELLSLAVSRASRDIIRLCEMRVNKMYMSHMSVPALGDLIESSPPSRIRMAQSFALNERMIIESCAAGWAEAVNDSTE